MKAKASNAKNRLKSFVPSTDEDLKSYVAAGKTREVQRAVTEVDPRTVKTLRVGDVAVARLYVEPTDPPRVKLELLPVGEFDWREARGWLAGLIELLATGDEIMNSKPGAAVTARASEESDMAKAKKSAKKAKGKSAAVKKEPGTKRESAAGMFKELIMAGGLTDDQIFAKVKAKYDLGDEKRSYVAWYRNQLKTQGQKPPAAKE